RRRGGLEAARRGGDVARDHRHVRRHHGAGPPDAGEGKADRDGEQEFPHRDPGRANPRRPVLRVQGRRPSPNTILTGVKKAILLALCVLGAVAAAPAVAAPAPPRVLVVHFGPDLEINPVTKDWINHQLGVAEHDGYDAVVIELDTPGGLSTSMKQIYNR